MASAWFGYGLVGLLQYHSVICALVGIYNMLHFESIFQWPCWFPLEFGMGRGPGLGFFVPFWCRDSIKPITWGWAAAELLFLLWFVRARRMHSALTQPPVLTDDERDRLFESCMGATECPRALLAGWFQDTTFEELKADNVVEWLAWALYSKHLEAVTPDERNRLDWYVARMESEWKLEIPPGYNPQLTHKTSRISLDALPAKPRPLWMYTLAQLARLCLQRSLKTQGFERRKCGALEYWIREPPSAHRRPIVLFHGIGIGASTYAPAVGMIADMFGHESAIILPEFDFISHRIWFEHPTSSAIVSALKQIVQLHSPSGTATFVGSSFGTIFASWMIKRAPECVGAAFLADPVVFLLHSPELCRNVAYPALDSAAAVLQKYFLVGELGIATTIHRHFWWFENVLWLTDIPERLHGSVAVALGSADFLVPASAIQRYLSRNPQANELLYVEGGEHVQWLGMFEHARKRALEMFVNIHCHEQHTPESELWSQQHARRSSVNQEAVHLLIPEDAKRL